MEFVGLGTEVFTITGSASSWGGSTCAKTMPGKFIGDALRPMRVAIAVNM